MGKFTTTCLILILGYIFCVQNLVAQEDQQANEKYTVFLRSGSQFEAILVEWKYGEEMTFELNGNLITIPNKEIQKIVQHGAAEEVKVRSPYSFKEQGLYHHVRINFIGGNGGNRSHATPGLGISWATGMRFGRSLSVGAGLSFDQYVMFSSENILAPFVEVSGYMNPENLSLMYNLSAGYGLAFKDEENGLMDSDGGWMIYPSFGFRTGKGTLKWTFDVGYKFQKARFEYDLWNAIRDQDIIFKRLTFRTGVMF